MVTKSIETCQNIVLNNCHGHQVNLEANSIHGNIFESHRIQEYSGGVPGADASPAPISYC